MISKERIHARFPAVLKKIVYKVLLSEILGAKEMVQCFRTLAALAEDLTTGPSTHSGQSGQL